MFFLASHRLATDSRILDFLKKTRNGMSFAFQLRRKKYS
jgi:hypothetical protein